MASSRRVWTPPESLTFDQSDRYAWDYSGENIESARRVEKRTGGQLYTQVDAGMDRAYLRGEHFVNRTGRYIVVRRPKSFTETRVVHPRPDSPPNLRAE